MAQRKRVTVALAAASLLGIGATSAGAAPIANVFAQAKSKTAVPFPTTAITNLKTGKSATLTSFAKVKTPVLVWFWAPH